MWTNAPYTGSFLSEMTKDEAKRAFVDGSSVTLAGTRYEYISALIYRKNERGDGVVLSLELYDRRGHAVAIAPVDKVEKTKEDSGQ